MCLFIMIHNQEIVDLGLQLSLLWFSWVFALSYKQEPTERKSGFTQSHDVLESEGRMPLGETKICYAELRTVFWESEYEYAT